ncbi:MULTISPECIES: AtzE family amidohydrolase [Acidiphilium]|uniref:Aspartyl-tRNA(Asn)/glutamyl-tRNA(Gln) amidotransferase subunit A n=1 Tax=Acidiphilium rubrum TaxID=526 RepID=A0A8G2CJW4_ACIRU|nr:MULTISPECIES: AtzE family amidohydrolase [Acidiphilium]SIQ62271.1 aspartyl-tRNA(Asn)/glutamyl-tRNA(Gln) amidotransferase subunit A [Acidiphilium rubrum]
MQSVAVPHRASATAIAAAVRGGRISARAVLEDHLARIAAHDGVFNCFTTLTTDRARDEADAVDAKIAAGGDAGPLAGVPVAVKNLYDIAGLPTRAGSKLYRDAAPAMADAPVLARLIDAGAVLLGALNMDEFAYGFTTENAHDGPTRNPHDVARSAGGSSGGSAAAVAAGFAPITLGSDTNGSIRLPAALCGVFGLKPTYGALDRCGTFPFVDSLDHLGPFARCPEDIARAFDVMRGVAPTPIGDAGEMRVATLGGWFAQQATPAALDAVRLVAAALGAQGEAVLPEAGRARAAAFCITAAEGGALHFEMLKTRAEEYDPATRPRLMAGALLPAHIVQAAQRFRAWFAAQAALLFERYDALLAPVTPCAAPLIGQARMMLGGKEVPVRPNLGLYTQPISFIGLPVVAVPVYAAGALPLGVQIITAPGREAVGLALAKRLEADGVTRAAVVP